MQNKDHTWRKIVNGDGLPTLISGSITIDGFTPYTNMKVTWQSFTTQGIPEIDTSNLSSDELGTITLQLPNNPQITVIGIRIGQTPKPTGGSWDTDKNENSPASFF